MKTKKFYTSLTAATMFVVFASSGAMSASATQESCSSLSVSTSASLGRPISFAGSDVGHQAIQVLWRVVEEPPAVATHFLGKLIGADQNWLGMCKYPGIGIMAGSGYDLNSRTVTLWVWSLETDLSAARASIVSYINSPSPAPPTSASTSTTYTTTTVADTTTTSTIQFIDTTTTQIATTTTQTFSRETIPEEESVDDSAFFFDSPAVQQFGPVTAAAAGQKKIFIVKKKKCTTKKIRVFSAKKKKTVIVKKRVCQ